MATEKLTGSSALDGALRAIEKANIADAIRAGKVGRKEIAALFDVSPTDTDALVKAANSLNRSEKVRRLAQEQQEALADFIRRTVGMILTKEKDAPKATPAINGSTPLPKTRRETPLECAPTPKSRARAKVPEGRSGFHRLLMGSAFAAVAAGAAGWYALRGSNNEKKGASGENEPIAQRATPAEGTSFLPPAAVTPNAPDPNPATEPVTPMPPVEPEPMPMVVAPPDPAPTAIDPPPVEPPPMPNPMPMPPVEPMTKTPEPPMPTPPTPVSTPERKELTLEQQILEAQEKLRKAGYLVPERSPEFFTGKGLNGRNLIKPSDWEYQEMETRFVCPKNTIEKPGKVMAYLNVPLDCVDQVWIASQITVLINGKELGPEEFVTMIRHARPQTGPTVCKTVLACVSIPEETIQKYSIHSMEIRARSAMLQPDYDQYDTKKISQIIDRWLTEISMPMQPYVLPPDVNAYPQLQQQAMRIAANAKTPRARILAAVNAASKLPYDIGTHSIDEKEIYRAKQGACGIKASLLELLAQLPRGTVCQIEGNFADIKDFDGVGLHAKNAITHDGKVIFVDPLNTGPRFRIQSFNERDVRTGKIEGGVVTGNADAWKESGEYEPMNFNGGYLQGGGLPFLMQRGRPQEVFSYPIPREQHLLDQPKVIELAESLKRLRQELYTPSSPPPLQESAGGQ